LQMPSSTHSRPTFVAAAVLWSAASLMVNILPVIFEALQHGRGLTAVQLGTLGTSFLLGTGVAPATGPFWVYRVDPRHVGGGAILTILIAICGFAATTGAGNAAYWWFAIGLASGALATPSYTALGYAPDPVRTYSLAYLTSIAFASLTAYGLSFIVLPRFGDKGVLIVIAILFAVAAPFVWSLRDVRVGSIARAQSLTHLPHSEREGRYPLELFPPIFAAFAGAAFTGIFMGGVYNFVASLALAARIDERAIGPIIATGMTISIGGAILPSVLGSRISSTVMIGLATAGMLVMYPLLMSRSVGIFGFGFAAHAFFGNLGYTYYLGVIRRLDFTDRIYVAYQALVILGLAVGAASSSYILSRYSPHCLFLIFGIVLTLTWFFLRIAENISARLNWTDSENSNFMTQ